MDYAQRYVNGEYEQVWKELLALGADVRKEPQYSLARRVADETMRRVRANCEQLVDRLQTLGYTFGVYQDGSPGYYSPGPLVPPDAASRADMATLEDGMGPLPLSLMAFWEQVGSVDFVGMHPEWVKGRDPLVVNPPEAAIAELDEADEMMDALGHFEASLAPDDLHKDNISGGSPYSVQLPDPAADFIILNERHNLHFVPYLRFAILRFRGFPGVEGGDIEFQYLPTLLDELEPF